MENGSVLEFRNPDPKFHDHLSEIIRTGCHQIIATAIETELQTFLEYYQDAKDEHGRQRIVRNGHLPERNIQTGIGSVAVKVPRTRDRDPNGGIQFRSNLLPPYLRRTRSIEELLPWLYLKGISTGDFSEALSSILGADAPGLSPNTIGRLKSKCKRSTNRPLDTQSPAGEISRAGLAHHDESRTQAALPILPRSTCCGSSAL